MIFYAYWLLYSDYCVLSLIPFLTNIYSLWLIAKIRNNFKPYNVFQYLFEVKKLYREINHDPPSLRDYGGQVARIMRI
jgi:hypothetical protein